MRPVDKKIDYKTKKASISSMKTYIREYELGRINLNEFRLYMNAFMEQLDATVDYNQYLNNIN